ncbi:terpenoid synthase [Aspergillus saccharolyticus JOP 1030-1]|uniref:Terpene synthase n=1 Tax=Aspergillus saccharolyticus JOP 1030-1 TaxID=1450539 RepID=A0A318ZB67_9EURO|nr:terpenoid synthase [Aspergillus saccharolyticus JOP 1030-1]PYH44681.1 terpenoid synthase [Aspergillus saccharolyticus JOP 1030-1]
MDGQGPDFHWPTYWPSATKLRGLHPQFTKSVCDHMIDEILAVLPIVEESKISNIRAMRIPALVAFMVPHSTSYERLTILCKWFTCLQLFDNLFDDPWFSDEKLPRLEKGLDSLPNDLRHLATQGQLTDGTAYPEYVHYVRGVLAEMFRLSPRKDQLLRAADYLERAIAAAHSRDGSSKMSDDLEQWKQCRVDRTGMFLLFHWMEFALDLHIPDEVWEDPTMQVLMDEACLQIGVVNDLYSISKEIFSNDCRVDSRSVNCVAWLMRGTGESLQEAVDRCWDYAHHLEDSVVHAAIVVKSRFRQNKAISQVVDAIVYSLQGPWAYQMSTAQHCLKFLRVSQPVPTPEGLKPATLDGSKLPFVVLGGDRLLSDWLIASAAI